MEDPGLKPPYSTFWAANQMVSGPSCYSSPDAGGARRQRALRYDLGTVLQARRRCKFGRRGSRRGRGTVPRLPFGCNVFNEGYLIMGYRFPPVLGVHIMRGLCLCLYRLVGELGEQGQGTWYVCAYGRVYLWAGNVLSYALVGEPGCCCCLLCQ